MIPALNSHYIIDGILQDLTPAQMLDGVLESGLRSKEELVSDYEILDETPEPGFALLDADPSKVEEYMRLVQGSHSCLPLPFAAEHTRFRIATALVDSMWRSGNFKLEDLPLTAKWCWNDSKVCNMSAFYASVEAAAGFLEDLNLSLRRYSFEDGEPSVRFSTPVSGAPLLCSSHMHADAQSWLIYVPFDTSDYRLGGSLLSQVMGQGGGVAPKIADPDYFADCFEVMREFVEDGVAIAGVTVCEGGLVSALQRISSGMGLSVDLSNVLQSNDEKNVVRVLFAEVPGALIQIRDSDFDYVDAEFLLQDVAFYPLGHPDSSTDTLRIKSSAKSGIQNILESLIHNAEGED